MEFSRDLSAWQMDFQRVVSAQGIVCPLPIRGPSQDCPQQGWMMPACSAATGPEQGRGCLWVPRLLLPWGAPGWRWA